MAGRGILTAFVERGHDPYQILCVRKLRERLLIEVAGKRGDVDA
jgi:hypothetical protein